MFTSYHPITTSALVIGFGTLISCQTDSKTSSKRKQKSKTEQSAKKTALPTGPQARFVNVAALVVRKQPTVESPKLNVLPYGTEVQTKETEQYDTFAQKNAPWHKLEGNLGYAFGGFLSDKEPPRKEQEMLIQRTSSTQFDISKEKLILFNGKCKYHYYMTGEGGEYKEFTQEGSYTLTTTGFIISLNPTVGQEGPFEEDVRIPAETITLNYNAQYRGWPSPEIFYLEKNGWKHNRKGRYMVTKEPCEYTAGMCENRSGYWHSPTK